MSGVDNGNQDITFQYQELAKGDNFNRMLREVTSPGFYKIATNVTNSGNTLTIPTFTAGLNVGTDKFIHVATEVTFEQNAVEGNGDTLVASYTWLEDTNNYIDWAWRDSGDASVTNEIILCQVTYNVSGVVTSVDNTVRTIGNNIPTNNLGIGLIAPQYPLHIQKSDNVLACLESTDATASLYLKDDTTSDFTGVSVTGDEISLHTGGTENLTLDTSGNLGILGTDITVLTSHVPVYRQAIINGSMLLAQRGTSFAAVANTDYTIDRYQYAKAGTMVHTISQDTDVPATSVSQTSLKLDCTTADASIAAGDLTIIYQKIEGYNFAPYVGQSATVSFWVKSAKTGIHCVSFTNSGTDRSMVKEYTVNIADTWEYKTINVTFDYTGGTWDYTNGIGIYVYFTLSAGSTWHTTKDVWQTGQFLATSNQVNVCDNTANNFLITDVVMNKGLIAMPPPYEYYSDLHLILHFELPVE